MTKVIKKGMKGEDIKKMQLALNALGYECGTADGIAGDKTIKAVQMFADAHTTVRVPESVTVSVKIGTQIYTGNAKV